VPSFPNDVSQVAPFLYEPSATCRKTQAPTAAKRPEKQNVISVSRSLTSIRGAGLVGWTLPSCAPDRSHPGPRFSNAPLRKAALCTLDHIDPANDVIAGGGIVPRNHGQGQQVLHD